MAEGRLKVAIVAGELADARALSLFEPLREHFDLMVHVIDGPALTKLGRSLLKILIYEAVPDMPGYMRGLEEALQGVDAIIGVETSRLSSFQAVRASRKFGIPLGVVAHEHHPYFYERYANIRAIQFDIINKADIFWASSDLAAAALRLDQVPEGSIRRIDPLVSLRGGGPNQERRAKFRNYVGIGPQERVLLFPHALEAAQRPEMALGAMRLLQRMGGDSSRGGSAVAPRFRLIFAGDGPSSLALKYQAVDLDVGAHVMFLHQDVEPFRHDLFAATDLVIMPRPMKREHHDEAPWLLLEAMAAGAVPLVGIGSLAAEWAGEGGLVYTEDTGEALAAAVQQTLADPVSFDRARQRGQQKLSSRHRSDLVPEAMIQDIRALAAARVRGLPAMSVALVVARAEREVAAGAERSALMHIEEALLAAPDASPLEYADLMAVKGEAHLALGELEEAMAAHSAALVRVERHGRALRGLGFLAWHSHSHEEALSFFKKALAVHDQDAEAMYGIGLVFRRLGLLDEALYWLEKSLAGSFALPAAFIAIAQAALASHHVGKAIASLERVVESAGEHKAVLMALGQLYVNSGHPEKGNEILALAMAAEPRRA